MRWLAQLGVGMFGLALAVPAWAQGVPADAGMPGYATTTAPTAESAPARHNHKGLFGWRHCVECQRARARAETGMDIPPPPTSAPMSSGMTMPGSVVPGHDHVHLQAQHVHQETCVACEQAAGATIVTSGPMMADPSAPGYASVGGPSAPGYATVGGPSPVGPGASPAPIGVARAHTGIAAQPGVFAGRPGPGTQDPSVMPTAAGGAVPPAQTAMGNSGPSSRPHILGHLFGISDMARERRERRGHSAQEERDHHAAISYDDKSQVVSEIPASMVYGTAGRDGH